MLFDDFDLDTESYKIWIQKLQSRKPRDVLRELLDLFLRAGPKDDNFSDPADIHYVDPRSWWRAENTNLWIQGFLKRAEGLG